MMPLRPVSQGMSAPGWPFDGLTPWKYGAILADPPWSYEMRSEKGYAKSPEAHYATMSIDAIKALPVRELAGPDCYLFLWATWPHLPQAMEVMTAWGFEHVTGGAWIKRTRNWHIAMGTGYVLRSACEPFLLGRIGRPQIRDRGVKGVVEAPSAIIGPEDAPDLIESHRREHSRKPPEMRQLIERLLPHQWFCELFGREPWPGHDVWGNEVGLFGGAL